MGTGQETARSAVTLQTVLDEPVMHRATCGDPAGSDDLRTVTWALPLAEVLAGAASDDLSGVMVHAGTAVIDRPIVERLVHQRACAVVVPERPRDDVIDAAHGRLAVVVADIGFYRLNRLVAEKSLAQRAHILEYGMNVHRELSEVLYRGSGLPAMTRQVSKLSGCPTFLLDVQLNVLAYESLFAPPAADPTEILRHLRARIEAGEPAHKTEEHGDITTTLTVALEHGPVTCVLCPIMLGGTTYGWVAVVELGSPPHRHDLAQHRAILEHGVSIIGAEMLRLRSVSEAEERARGDFAHALLHGRYTDPAELATRAAFHDFDTHASYGVIVVEGTAGTGTTAGLERQGNLARWVREHSRPGGPKTMAAIVGDLLCVIREIPAAVGPHGAGDQADLLAEFAHDLSRDLRARTSAQLRVAYGRPANGAPGIATSYREARIALSLAGHLGLGRMAAYGDLRVYALMAELASSPSGHAFADEVLAPLRDQGGADDLEDVVLAYIASGGNLNAVARSLGIHRNTVQYKLSRASRLLGMDLHQAENRFTIWLASRLDLLTRVQHQVGA